MSRINIINKWYQYKKLTSFILVRSTLFMASEAVLISDGINYLSYTDQLQ